MDADAASAEALLDLGSLPLAAPSLRRTSELWTSGAHATADGDDSAAIGGSGSLPHLWTFSSGGERPCSALPWRGGPLARDVWPKTARRIKRHGHKETKMAVRDVLLDSTHGEPGVNYLLEAISRLVSHACLPSQSCVHIQFF